MTPEGHITLPIDDAAIREQVCLGWNGFLNPTKLEA